LERNLEGRALEMNAHRIALPLLVLSFAACGGTVSSTLPGSGAGGGGPDGEGTQPSCDSAGAPPCQIGLVSDSFELLFTSVDRSAMAPDAPALVGFPSEANHVRVDVVRDASGARSSLIVSPRWGDPVEIHPTSEDGAGGLHYLVDGPITLVDPNTVDTNARDTWSSIELVLQSDGGFKTTFTATGQENRGVGDTSWSAAITGTGTLEPDTLAPEAKVRPAPSGRAGHFLPWDPVTIDFAEPVNFGAQIALSGAGATYALGPAPTVSSTLALASFDLGAAGAAKPSIDVVRTSVVMDPSMNPMLASTLGSVTFRDVGAATALQDFVSSDAGKTFAAWGTLDAAATRCEGKSCVAFGPFEKNTGDCQLENGVAGRITRGAGTTKLRITYRVFLGPAPYGGSGAPELIAAPLFVDTSASQRTSPMLATSDFSATGDAEFPYATAWTTLDVPISGSANEVGFSVHPGYDACFIPPVAMPALQVLVDSVTAVP
jgi:hypothetical protein